MKNPFEGVFGRKAQGGEGTRESARDELGGRVEEVARAVADQAMLEKGQLDAHLMTLRHFSKEATERVLELEDLSLSDDEFEELVEDFNETHERPESGAALVENFSVPLGRGRTVEVSLYEGGAVVLAGSVSSIH